MRLPDWLPEIPGEQPHPLAFATVSGAHLYGFPSADSDVDLRGASYAAAGVDEFEVTCQAYPRPARRSVPWSAAHPKMDACRRGEHRHG